MIVNRGKVQNKTYFIRNINLPFKYNEKIKMKNNNNNNNKSTRKTKANKLKFKRENRSQHKLDCKKRKQHKTNNTTRVWEPGSRFQEFPGFCDILGFPFPNFL